ncbi:MAG: hypothetical protein K1W27_04035 [Lachnospiraceae bacterium]
MIVLYLIGMLDSSVALFVHMSYIVFTGVMIAAYIVGAYEKKTMNLMFSYPIERKRIILAKVSAVWIFNFLAMVTSKIVIYIALVLSKSFMGITAQSIPIGELSFWLDIVLSSAAMVRNCDEITHDKYLSKCPSASSENLDIARYACDFLLCS